MRGTSLAFSPVVLATLWVGAMACTLYLLLIGDGASERPGGPGWAAELTSCHGDTEVRDEDALVWGEAKAGQHLSYGQRLATGDHSGATVLFPGGRRVRLGPQTQIIIAEDSASGTDKKTLIISLITGQLAALPATPSKPMAKRRSLFGSSTTLTPPEVQPPVAIRSGNEQIVLTKKDDAVEALKSSTGAVVLTKASPGIQLTQIADTLADAALPVLPQVKVRPVPTQKLANFAAAPLPYAASAPANAPEPPTAAALPRPVAAESEGPSRTAEPGSAPRQAPLTTSGLEPSLKGPYRHQVLWSETSLRAGVRTLRLPLPLAAPPSIPAGVRWLPYLRATRLGNDKSLVSRERSQDNTLYLSLASLLTPPPAPAELVHLRLAVGVTVKRGDEKAVSMAPVPDAVAIASLADLAAARSLSLRLQPGDWQEGASHDWVALLPAAAGVDTFVLRLVTGSDSRRLLPLIRGARAFTATAALPTLPGGTATCFVRDGRVVATIHGTVARSLQLRIASALGASLTYIGTASAFIAEAGSATLPAVIASRHDTIYVIDGRRGDGRYPILPTTLQGSPLLTAYIKDAQALFSEQVEILQAETKPMDHHVYQ